MRVLLVPDLKIENWRSMDLYAERMEALLPEIDPSSEFRFVRTEASSWIDRSFNLPYLRRGLNDRFYSRYLLLPRTVARVRAEFQPEVCHVLDHSYAHVIRRLDERKTIITVHDLYPFHLIHSSALTGRAQARKRLLQWVMDHLGRAAHLIADSEFTKRELMAFTDYSEENISVVPLGGDHLPVDEVDEGCVAAFKLRCQVENHSWILLHVGSCDERKNIATLLRAFAVVLKSSGPDLYLVQIGGRFSSEQATLISQLGIANRVRQIVGVSATELACAYRACSVMLFPSTYEGFGLPVVEAMTAGKPVVALRAGSLPELIGDGGVLVEANDSIEFARAALAVLDDQLLWQRLSHSAKQRASQFTWRKTANETLAVYRRVFERE